MRSSARSLILIIATLATGGGCAAMGGGGGGGENLPNRGIVPYERWQLVVGETVVQPFVLAPEDPAVERWLAPHAEVVDDAVVVWFEVAPTDADEPGWIGRAVSGDEGVLFDAPTVALDGADLPPVLGDRPTSPSIARYEGQWILAFGYGEGEGIGLAWSLDGERFTPLDEPALTKLGAAEAGGIGSPSLVATEEGLLLAYEARSDGTDTAIIRQASADWTLAFERAGTVLLTGTACEGPDGQPESCWDAGAVGSPELRPAVSASGDALLRLFYHGGTGSKGSLGFAASWEGGGWSRYAFNPVLDDSYDQREPTNVRFGDRYHLYFAEERSKLSQGIALAINAEGHANELF